MAHRSNRKLDKDVISTCKQPFSKEGGLKLLKGNLGRSVIKVSAVKAEHRIVRAPAVILSIKMKFKSNLMPVN